MTVLDTDIRADTSIWPALSALTACLCQTLADDNMPPVCICSPMPGDTIDASYVSEDAGMAWVRLENAYPSTSFPVQDPTAACVAPLGFALEMGVLYCSPAPGPDGSPPDMPSQYDATRLQLAVMSSMRRALLCCFPAGSPKDLVLGAYTPMGPDGGVVGGAWTLYLAEGAI